MMPGGTAAPDNPSIEDRDVTAQHPLRGDVAVLVPAAGLGTRLGPGVPKALRELRGVPLLVHALRRIGEAPSVGCIVVAVPPATDLDLRPFVPARIELPSDFPKTVFLR